MQRAFIILLLPVAVSLPTLAHADPPSMLERLSLDATATLTRFEQQVKTEIGGARGERLVEDTLVGLNTEAMMQVWGPLSAGLFARLDVGKRNAGRFQAVDAEGKTVVSGEVGGAFSEFWLGPLVRASYRSLFFDLGYGLLGVRHDDARDDLPSTGGATDNSLRTSPTVAWRFALGGRLDVLPTLAVSLSLQYRVRYYDRRADGDLAGNLVHGTQDLTPFVGVTWTPFKNSAQ